MSRYRMWPTKDNFPGRWSGTECNVCGVSDTDEHVLSCPGYKDIFEEVKFDFEVFWDKDVLNDFEKLREIAVTVIKLLERMEEIQSLSKS